MRHFRNILVFQPAAIGDCMFATPVAKVIKENLPPANITWWTHGSTADLLSLCPYIDQTWNYQKSDGIKAQRKQIQNLSPDLIIDLVGSLRAHLLTAFCRAKVLHFKKHDVKCGQHIVDNLLETVNPLSLPKSDARFPTLTTEGVAVPNDVLEATRSRPVALVPSVGALRSNRAWTVEAWIETGKQIKADGTKLVLVGGPEDQEICRQVAQGIGANCLNFAGMLTLCQTASLLSGCRKVISADTGPAHIAVAVGTPVIGIFGPTLVSRNGPYGFARLCLDNSSHCACLYEKSCHLTGTFGPGKCMQAITVDQVMSKYSLNP